MRARITEAYAALPLLFEANRGQADGRVKFLARGDGYNIFLSQTEAVLTLRIADFGSRNAAPQTAVEGLPEPQSAIIKSQPTVVRIKLAGARAAARMAGMGKLASKCNYLTGNDPRKWIRGIATYSAVKCEQPYRGVDVVYHGAGAKLEYDFNVAPGADPGVIGLEFEGADGLSIDEAGGLVLRVSRAEVRQPRPVAYQQKGGVRREVGSKYVMRGKARVGIEVAEYDRSLPLVIDPVLVYSKSIGGRGNDSASGIAIDASGSAYITGTTDSPDFPAANPARPKMGETDAFVTKLTPAGDAIVYSTYLGGDGDESGNAIAVDSSGSAYVTGATRSNNFPATANAFQTGSHPGGDAFVTKLTPAGNALAYSTYLGGGGGANQGFTPADTVGNSIAVDREGSAYVTGVTFSPGFPVKRALQEEFNNGQFFNCCTCFYTVLFFSPTADAFVTKLNASGTSAAYSTFLGGISQDEGRGIAVDSAGSVYVAGRTCSADFPGANRTYGGGLGDGFLVKLNPSGREFVYSRYIGGSGEDIINGVAVDTSGNAYVAGETHSPDLQTTGAAFQRALGGGTFYKSVDGGINWSAAVAGIDNVTVNDLAVNPANPAIIYAGVAGFMRNKSGTLKSTDGGNTWTDLRSPGAHHEFLRIDPQNPAIIYAAYQKSTDAGLTWKSYSSLGVVNDIVIDPQTPTTLYAGTGGAAGDVIVPGGAFKSTDRGESWKPINNGLNVSQVNRLAIDPKTPSTLYAGSESFVSGGVFKTTDGGSTWKPKSNFSGGVKVLVVDASNPSIIYADKPESSKLAKSTDGGESWSDTGLSGPVRDLIIDPLNSSVLYAAVSLIGRGGAVFKSTDGGATWNATGLTSAMVQTLAIDPHDPSTVYAGAFEDVDAFIIKLSPAGDALIYSTYLGDRGRDSAAGIAVDVAGNAYVTGSTFSARFPTKDAFQANKASGLFDATAFVTKLTTSGAALDYSTYLGGNPPNDGSAIAADGAGKAYVAGSTTRFPVTPIANNNPDAFVAKLVSPAKITGVSIKGKKLIVTGEGFDRGSTILVDGQEQTTRNDESAVFTALVARKAGKNIAPGQRVTIQVRNSEGLLSNVFSFTRPGR